MIPYFCAHCDTALPVWAQGKSLRRNDLELDLMRLGAYAPRAQVFAVCVERRGEVVRTAQQVVEHFLSQLGENADCVRLCCNAVDITKCNEEGKLAALLSIEGAEQFDCDLDALRELYARGLRVVHITWNHDNALGGAAMDGGGGLTARGRAFVSAAQEMGLALDLSHLSDAGFWEVLELAEKPVLAGHSNARALCAHPRNLTDEQFRALVRTGGAAGLNLCADFLGLGRDIDAVVAHAEHWLGLGGEKTVCLGTDFDGVDALPRGIAGVESMGALYEAMLRRNWDEGLVRDIFYNNLCNFFGRAL